MFTKLCRQIPKFVKNKTCALQGYYAASSGNSLQLFRDNLWVTSSRVKIHLDLRIWDYIVPKLGKELPLLSE